MKKHSETIIDKHIKGNLKEYIFAIIIFSIGIIIGTIYINNVELESKMILNSEQTLKEILEFNLSQNIKIAILTILASTSIIGTQILSLYIMYRGFSMAIASSILVMSYGKMKGILAAISCLYISNSCILIGIVVISISTIKLFKNIVHKQKSVKVEMVRHLMICTGFIILVILCAIIQSIVQNISTKAVI